jgi:F0F1-type ATP synthase membrane subunit c/vacuolar-type H+-ATPase subunit K
MTAVALLALGVAALAPLVLATQRVPRWMSQWAAPLVGLAALAAAAVAGSATTPVKGFALGATLVLCAAAATTGGAPMVLAAFRIARRQPDSGDDPRPEAGPLRGGRVIGLLERAAVAAAILAGWPEGIAVVLAVKSLARYPELREPHASEQFIIGTFTSVLWAIAVCGVGRALIT